MEVRNYKPAPTVREYILSDEFVSAVIGPLGSGKTLGSIVKWTRAIHMQARGSNGIRHTRTVVIRNTYTELKDTTVKSFTEWFGDALNMNYSNMTGVLEYGDVKAELLFRSLDKPADMSKLLSLEITYAYLNELRELPPEALYNVTSRLGRFPSPVSGATATCPMAWADTNAFDNTHWAYKLLIEERPSNHAVFIQPPAILEDGSINPNAENLENLPSEYYGAFMEGKPKDWIDVMAKVKFIPLQTGKPVYPEYNDQIHCIDEHKIRKPDINRPLICSSDNGRWSAFLIGQLDAMGNLVIFDELISNDISLTEFSRQIKIYMQENYHGYRFETWLDPWAANQRGQVTDETMFMVYNEANLNPRVTDTKSPTTMVEAVKKKLQTLSVGQPAMLISSKCKSLRKALNGGYQYKRINIGGEKYAEKPDKGAYSHVCFTPDTLIHTPAGLKKLGSLSVGDVVLTPNGSNKITAMQTREDVDVVQFSNGLTCTPDHPFFTTSGYLRADAIEFLVNNQRSILWTTLWNINQKDQTLRVTASVVGNLLRIQNILLRKHAHHLVETTTDTATVISIEVANDHAYYVGVGQHLVSNCNAMEFCVDGTGASRDLLTSSKFKQIASSGKQLTAGKGFNNGRSTRFKR